MGIESIVLFGMMGVGKSIVAKELADRLEWKLYDIDDEIEKREGISIEEIFKNYGEERFRSLEREMVLNLYQQKKVVIATGGGIVFYPENIDVFCQVGLCICLNDDIEVIYNNIKSRKQRPLLEGGDKREILNKMYQERRELYHKIEIQIDCNNKPVNVIVDEILSIKNNKEN